MQNIFKLIVSKRTTSTAPIQLSFFQYLKQIPGKLVQIAVSNHLIRCCNTNTQDTSFTFNMVLNSRFLCYHLCFITDLIRRSWNYNYWDNLGSIFISINFQVNSFYRQIIKSSDVFTQETNASWNYGPTWM